MIAKHRILYAEDDLDDLFIVKQAFQHHGDIELVHAPNGKEALSMLAGMQTEGTLPCLIILDINMPVLNGRDALAAIKKDNGLRNIPVVLFTTSNSPSDKIFANQYDADLVVKPISYESLEIIATEFMNRCDFTVNN